MLLPTCLHRPTAAGRQKFEIYVCTAADRQYALEVRSLTLFSWPQSWL